MTENGKFLSRDLLSQWSLEQATVCNDRLENIVLNEKWASEQEDNLEIEEWREDKVGSLFVLWLYLPYLMGKCW